MLGDIVGEGYYAFAEHDTYVPLSDVAKFEKLLAVGAVPLEGRDGNRALITAMLSAIAAISTRQRARSTTSACWHSIDAT